MSRASLLWIALKPTYILLELQLKPSEQLANVKFLIIFIDKLIGL